MNFLILSPKGQSKVPSNGPSKVCGIQSLKKLK